MSTMSSRAPLLIAAGLASLAASGMAVIHLGDGPGLSRSTIDAMSKQGQKPTQDVRNDLRAMIGGGIGSPYSTGRRAGYGWTNMHAKRVARKKRNQARHRAACRG